MPRLDPEQSASGPRIHGFTADGAFRVDGASFAAGVMLTPTAAAAWSPPVLARLDEADLAAILHPLPEFLLLGTGAAQAQPPLALRQALDTRGVGIEAMDSRAAARLWGVLRAEGRAIAAALYPLNG